MFVVSNKRSRPSRSVDDYGSVKILTGSLRETRGGGGKDERKKKRGRSRARKERKPIDEGVRKRGSKKG